jgi:hypothetical protein
VFYEPLVYHIIVFEHASPLDIWEKEGKSSQCSLKAKHIASLLICNTHILSLVAVKGNGMTEKNYSLQSDLIDAEGGQACMSLGG